MVCGSRGVKLWNVVDVGKAQDGRPRWSFKQAAYPSRSLAGSVCFSPDGRFFAWTTGNQVSVCERATGQVHSWPVNVFFLLALSFLPDGKHLGARRPGHGND